MKGYKILLILFLFTYQSSFAQDGVLTPKVESPKYNYNKIMLIPYHEQRAYLVMDGTDRKLAEANDMDLGVFRDRIKYGLNESIQFKMLSRYDTKSMLTDESPDVVKDMGAMHNNVSYQYEKPYSTREVVEEEKKSILEKVKQNFKKKPNDKSKSPYTAAHYKEAKAGDTYMNVKIRDKKLIEYMAEKYESDLFVFVNMIEMKMDFKTCLDLQTDNYARDFTVHFSIFDKNSNQLWGDKVTAVMGSNVKNISEIMEGTFPLISEHMVMNLPVRKKGGVDVQDEKERIMLKE